MAEGMGGSPDGIDTLALALAKETEKTTKLRTELKALKAERDELSVQASVDGPMYRAGRLEGHADMCAELRMLLDPRDTHHWNRDGLLGAVVSLRDRMAQVQELVDEGECFYGDNCPSFGGTRHGRCEHCKLRCALDGGEG